MKQGGECIRASLVRNLAEKGDWEEVRGLCSQQRTGFAGIIIDWTEVLNYNQQGTRFGTDRIKRTGKGPDNVQNIDNCNSREYTVKKSS